MAYACLSCNRNKGSDIASLSPQRGTLVRFFHPRRDRWDEHFRFDDGDSVTVMVLTDVGEATARIFGFNATDRLLERQSLKIAGRYPPPAAWRRINGTQ